MNKIIDEKLVRFILIGVLNTLIGTAIMFGLYNIFGCSYWISSASNYILVSIFSYFLNKKFTFRHHGETLKSGAKFAVNILVCYFAAYGIAKPAVMLIMVGSSVYIQENAAMLAGMCIFTGLNYLGQRFFVFGETTMDYMDLYKQWLNSPYLSDDEKQELRDMSENEIFEAFYKKLHFGTSGMRGIMGLGTNMINKHTIRMAAKGVAEFVGSDAKVVVAYDTRHNSKQLAEETAKVLAASNVRALLFDRYSPVPLLSFAIRYLNCDGGIVITASHNTKIYNGFKVYDNTGCQICDEPAEVIADNINKIDDKLGIEIADMTDKNISYIGQEVVDKFIDAVLSCKLPISEESAEKLKVVYTPLHGSGRDYVVESLRKAGFNNLLLVSEQADFNGAFPTVRKPNPEDKAVFAISEKKALENDADVIIGTDPDCDRMGVGVNHNGQMIYLSGNQTGALLTDFLCKMKSAERKTFLTSIVTGDMGAVIAQSHGADVIRRFTGFKNLGAEINKLDDDDLLIAYEESYGYLAGTHTRDKDGVLAALLVCQMAAYWKEKNLTLIDALNDLFEVHGYYIDDQSSFVFEGSAGEQKISHIMKKLREKGNDNFSAVGEVQEFIDYSKGINGMPASNLLKYIFNGDSWLAVRPSGTEPKIKFYYCIKGKNKEIAENVYNKLKMNVENMVNQYNQ